jgi:ABC-type multidrug transport system ATPase subunit
MAQGRQEKCPNGFYCPENTAQPLYCCAGYYCPDPATIHICPQGKFCPQGSTVTQGCHFLASCPEGSKTVSKIGVFGLFLALVLVIAATFAVKNRRDNIKRLKYRHLLQYGYGAQDESANVDMGQVERTFDISFTDLGLVLPSGVEIMRGVSGELKSSRCCAILGPSGAGKTTFVSLLTGKARRTSGQVRINGVNESLSKYNKLIGFVPQEDVMLRELTVRDILIHSALMRLPAELPLHAKKKKVLETIEYLELGHVMDSIIGDEATRGISGGQRKRVNIGMELVANPSVLFLDEPTSGLDSATSYEVCSLLRNIAHKQQLTVAAVIHSPSPQAFNQFDDLLILGKGGRVVYFGPRDKALDYFHRIGFTCPPDENPADYYIAVTSGKVRSAFTADFHPKDLFTYWERFERGEEPFTSSAGGGKFHRMSIMENGARLDIDIKEGEGRGFGGFLSELVKAAWSGLNDAYYYIVDVLSEFFSFLFSTIIFCRRDPVRSTPNAFVVFWLCSKRAWMQIYRSQGQFIYDQLLHLGCGAFISIASRQFDYLGRQPRSICNIAPIALQYQCNTPIDHIAEVGVFMSLGVLFSGISVGAATFGNEKVVFWRDTAAGMQSIPYYLAKVVADLPRCLVAALCFSLSFIVFFPYRSSYVFIYSIIMLLYFVAFAMGYFISMIVKKETVGLVGTAFALAWAIVLSGVIPDLHDVNTDDTYDYIRWLWKISAPRYAIEALFIKEVGVRPFQEIHEDQLPHDYDLNNYGRSLLMLVLIAIAWNFIAFLFMKLTHREKTK